MRLHITILLTFCTFIGLTAQVTYTDINPDTVISASTTDMFQTYEIDLNHDGTNDFYIKHFHPSDDYRDAEFYTYVGQSAEILTDNQDVPLALNAGETVNSNGSKWVNTATQSSSNALFMSANWAGKQDKYVGLRVKIASQWHYGWLRLSIPADTSEIIIKDYAYNNTINESITAGNKWSTQVKTISASSSVITLYPNPVQGHTTISIRGIDPSAQPCIVSLYDMCGSLIYKAPWQQETFDIGSNRLVPGIYLLTVDAAGIMYSAKLVAE